MTICKHKETNIPLLLLDPGDLEIHLSLVFLLFQECLVVLGNQDLPFHLSG